MNGELEVPANRLIDAVDALLIGLSEIQGRSASCKPSEILGADTQPALWCDFTSHEIREAERFLERCGILPL